MKATQRASGHLRPAINPDDKATTTTEMTPLERHESELAEQISEYQSLHQEKLGFEAQLRARGVQFAAFHSSSHPDESELAENLEQLRQHVTTLRGRHEAALPPSCSTPVAAGPAASIAALPTAGVQSPTSAATKKPTSTALCISAALARKVARDALLAERAVKAKAYFAELAAKEGRKPKPKSADTRTATEKCKAALAEKQ